MNLRVRKETVFRQSAKRMVDKPWYSILQNHLLDYSAICPSSILAPMKSLTLTPLLPQPVKFPGWKMHVRACKQYIFRSYSIYFQCYTFWCKSFHTPFRKRKQKGLRVSNFAFSLAIFKRHHGSEGVNNNSNLATVSVTLFRHSSPTFKRIGKRQPAVTYDIAAAGVQRHDFF